MSMTAVYARAGDEAASHCSGRAFVVGNEILEAVLLACITLDTFHDAFAADGAVIGDIVVHAAVLLGAEDASGVLESSLEDIYDVAVSRIEDQMTPADFMHLAGKLKVVIPAESFGCFEL